MAWFSFLYNAPQNAKSLKVGKGGLEEVLFCFQVLPPGGRVIFKWFDG